MNNKNYKISVIVPIYNNAKYLKKCIDSIIYQTYKNLEIILVNDGSTDSSGKIADEYQKKDNRIKVIHQKNAGVSIARNVGLKNATGNFIGFVDSDDWIEKNMFEMLLESIIKYNVDISICNLSFENENGIIIKSYDEKEGILSYEEYIKNIYYSPCIQGYTCNKLYKTSLIKENNIQFDKTIFVLEDDLFNFEILYKNKKQVKSFFLNQKLYHYIDHNTNVSKSNFNLKKLSYLVVRDKEINYLKKMNIDVNYLKVDYCASFIRANILMKKNKIKKPEIYYDLLKKFKIYKKEIKLKDLDSKIKIKFLVIKYFNWIYNLKILFCKEK